MRIEAFPAQERPNITHVFDVVTLPIKGKDATEQRYDDSGELIYDEDGITILFKDFEYSVFDKDNVGIYVPGVLIEAVNRTDKAIIVDAKSCLLNDCAVESPADAGLLPNTRKLYAIEWSVAELNGDIPAGIYNAEMSFEIIDADSYDTIGTIDNYRIDCIY